MSEKRLIDQLSEPFPPNAIEQREGAFGKMLSYVAAETVIRRLNRLCPEWSFRQTGHEWTEPIEWTDKKGAARTSRTLVYWGELTIPGLGTRSGTGVQVIDERSGEDLIKGALSDCLKNCAKHFGVGIDLYGPDLEAGELPDHRPITHRQNAPAATTGPQDGKPQARSGVPPTEPQFKKVGALARSLGMSDGELHQFAGVPSLNGLDRAQMSALIEKLTALEADADDADEDGEHGWQGGTGPSDGGPLADTWTGLWQFARSLGIADKAALEQKIGVLGPNPTNVRQRLDAWAKENARQLAVVS